MSQAVIECPTGLVVKVREFKVKDENLLANKKAVRKGTATTDLLASITTEVLDAGPYQLDPGGKFDWSQALQGDRIVVLLKNRIETWGPEFSIDQPCPNAACREPNHTVIDLTELELKPLPESSLPHVQGGLKDAIAVKLPKSEAVIGFRLLNGADDRQLQKLQKQKADELSSALIRYRVLWARIPEKHEWAEKAKASLEKLKNVGVQATPQAGGLILVPPPMLPAFIEDMSGRDSAYLRSAFDEHDCGVEQEVQFECDACDHIWKDDVRFTADFLFPKYRGKTSTIS